MSSFLVLSCVNLERTRPYQLVALIREVKRGVRIVFWRALVLQDIQPFKYRCAIPDVYKDDL